MNVNRLLRRQGGRYDGPYARFEIPGHPGVFDFYAVKRGRDGYDAPNYRVPLRCVDDAPGNPDDGACHLEYA